MLVQDWMVKYVYGIKISYPLNVKQKIVYQIFLSIVKNMLKN